MDFTPFLNIARERSSKDPAHDFLHVMRVVKNSQTIMQEVPADQEIVFPAIFLHEIFNYPKGDPRSRYSGEVCADQASVILEQLNYPIEKRDMVLDCIRYHSFSRGATPQHIEGKIVQDADRIDAIGAIGIARLFATSAEMKRPFYHLEDPFAEFRALDDKEFGLDHFGTKLLKLSEGLHTKPAKEMAIKRVDYMKNFLLQFRSEIL